MSDTTHISETVSAGQLRAFIERIERLEEEIKSLNADKSEVYAEMRGVGFDVKAVRQCVAARKLDSAEREERNAIFDLYWEALTGFSRVHVHEGREPAAPNASNRKASNGKSAGTPAALTDTQEQPETARQPAHPRHEDHRGAETAEAEASASHSPSPANAPRLAADDEAAQANPTSSAPIPNPRPNLLPGAVKAPEAGTPPPASGATLSEKKDCLKLRNGHCKISFETSALCSECNRAKAENARAA